MTPSPKNQGKHPSRKQTQTVKLPKPRWRLSSEREKNPEAHKMDADWESYQARISTIVDGRTTPPTSSTGGPDDEDDQSVTSPAQSTRSALSLLDELVREQGIDPDTPEGIKELARRIGLTPQEDVDSSDSGSSLGSSSDSNRTVKPEASRSEKLSIAEGGLPPGNEDDPFVSKPERAGTNFTMRLPGFDYRNTDPEWAERKLRSYRRVVSDSLVDEPRTPSGSKSRSTSQRSIEAHESILSGSPSSRYELASLLDNINDYLDQLEIANSSPKIMEPPQTPILENPLIKSSGMVLIQCETGTCYKVHRMLLWIHSAQHYAHSRANPGKLPFELDVDEKTLDIFVDWLYHRSVLKKPQKSQVEEVEEEDEDEGELIDLSRFSTDQICSLVTLSLMLRVARLYNAALKILFRRYLNWDDFRCPGPDKFSPSEDVLQKMYRESREPSPVRKALGFLIAKGDPQHPGPVVGWELEMARDVESVAETVRRDGWEAVDLNAMFMYSWDKRDRKWTGRFE